MNEEIQIEKLVHGGQGLGTLASGKRAFVWNALPGETVSARVIRKKSGFVDAIAEEIVTASLDRIDPLEPDAYLSTSPWQVLAYDAEARAKQSILEELFSGEKVKLDWQPFAQRERRFGYRNKMEYNFWWVNETGQVSLALHRRGSHMKLPLQGSVLASDAINNAGEALIEFINVHKIEARRLKSVILRSQADGSASAVLYVVDREVLNYPWAALKLNSFTMYFSNPKSPASVATEQLLHTGPDYMTDHVAGRNYRYSPEGFFQINLPIYEDVLKEIAEWVSEGSKLVDMYAGVGSIGMSLPFTHLTSVELDESSSKQAMVNAEGRSDIEVVLSESEKALDYITGDAVIVLDPPRAGLHKKVVEKLLEVKPARVVYLSCNPATQARDIAMLVSAYKIVHARGYNFFPATPHIESLIVLELK